ncbi:MAG: peroxiredoxin [Sandaracinaceae bacterium]|nr:peroxiredoxin [Sandaracinaceae bacterium]
MTARVQKVAPEFSSQAVQGDEIVDFSLASLRGKYVVLFFWPYDFTFVCPTEIIAFDAKLDAFRERGAEVVGVSTDSAFTHLAWQRTSRDQGGLGGVRYPLVADVSRRIATAYGVLIEDGVDEGAPLRGLFLIDREGVVRHVTINDLGIGRNVDEALRVLDALKFTEEHGEVCPANWRSGEPGIVATPDGARAYFATHAD